MNKTEMIREIAQQTGLTQAVVDTAVSAFLNMVGTKVAEGEKVQLLGFGTFEPKTYAARVGHHPQTGEEIKVPETKSVAFKPGKALKDAVK